MQGQAAALMLWASWPVFENKGDDDAMLLH
jgi:hypothetical protein